jgi:hypothetical protein
MRYESICQGFCKKNSILALEPNAGSYLVKKDLAHIALAVLSKQSIPRTMVLGVRVGNSRA